MHFSLSHTFDKRKHLFYSRGRGQVCLHLTHPNPTPGWDILFTLFKSGGGYSWKYALYYSGVIWVGWFIDVYLFNVEGRVTILGGHLNAPSVSSDSKSSPVPKRVRPPITTHVLDVARGCPASGIEVMLETYNAKDLRPMFGESDRDKWMVLGSSMTDKDGRSGQLMKMVNDLSPGVYRISFNTGKYNPDGFFPVVSIVFEVRESQKKEHFHVPLLLSPFSFSTYRGS